jgi:hypothetical protein
VATGETIRPSSCWLGSLQVLILLDLAGRLSCLPYVPPPEETVLDDPYFGSLCLRFVSLSFAGRVSRGDARDGMKY